jgi:Tol biopolymer transport system component
VKVERTHGGQFARMAAAMVVCLSFGGQGLAIAANLTSTVLVGAGGAGLIPNDWSDYSSVSDGGAYVAFHSQATNLVASDTNEAQDVFVWQRSDGTTTRESVSSDGTQANGWSETPVISPDGRFVAFGSNATNLVEGDTNGREDVFLRDRESGATTIVSLASDGTQGNGDSLAPAISADGRYIAFMSGSTNLAPGTGSGWNVFVHDTLTGTTALASTPTDGTPVPGSSSYDFPRPDISADGRYVVFSSDVGALAPDAVNYRQDVFVRDTQADTTTLISVSPNGQVGNDDSFKPSISADGRSVAFLSQATNLVPGDTNLLWDVFVRELQAGSTTRVSVSSGGAEQDALAVPNAAPRLSGDGRYVAFDSSATTLAPFVGRPKTNVYVHDMQTGSTVVQSVAPDGTRCHVFCGGVRISPDGGWISFTGLDPLVSSSAQANVYLRDLSAPIGQPDAAVGGAGAPLHGVGTYRPSGSGENAHARVRRGDSARFRMVVANRSIDADTILISGPRSVGGASYRYVMGSRNVTKRVSGGGLSTSVLAPGDTVVMHIRVSISRSTPLDAVMRALITSRSQDQPALRDGVVIRTDVDR